MTLIRVYKAMQKLSLPNGSRREKKNPTKQITVTCSLIISNLRLSTHLNIWVFISLKMETGFEPKKATTTCIVCTT